ncbi:RHS repeat-associated core domain-containing protein [Paraburkholderia caribensis]|uniref:RHS repeat-associated core domain-containing protein n=1 Tax=Paraburkholderia caribensis TaxID=75105 RepID=UPI001D08EB68|nr:RHS repeat-associated core domain-containing protein [Paraburkholderia caribensis]
MPDTGNYTEPGGTAQQRIAGLQTLEDGEKTKRNQMGLVDGANYGMFGADVGYAASAGGSAALAGGASGAAAIGAGALAAAPAVVAFGGALLMEKLGVTHALAEGFTSIGDALGLTIGRGDPHPACVGDKVAHSSGFWGIVAGLAIGVAIGAAIAATVATGGLAGAVIVGAIMAGGLTLGSALAQASQSMGSNCGEIRSGSDNVYFEKKKVARVTDLVHCEKHSGAPEPIVDGSKTIFVNGLPLVRIGHETHCSGKINSGSESIWIDKTVAQYGPKNPELTAGQEFIAGLLGGLIGAKLGSAIGEGIRAKPSESAEQGGVRDEHCACVKDPIDVVTGEVVEVRIDLQIPGVLPLEFKRRYRTHSDDRGLLGPRWSDNWSQMLTLVNGRTVRFSDGAGLTLGFDAPTPTLNGINLREPRYHLNGNRDEPCLFDRETRQTRKFSALVEGQPSRLMSIEDLDGNFIALSYDEQKRLIRLAHSDGYEVRVTYDAHNPSPSEFILDDAQGQTLRLCAYAYRDGILVKAESFQSGTLHYEYDTQGWMTGWRDTDQTIVHHRYDRSGRVVETGTLQGYHSGKLIYEDGRTRVIDADGEWIYEYNNEGLVTRTRNPLGGSWQYSWQLGRLMSKTDPLGRSTFYDYSDVGQLRAVTDPTGAVTRFRYDDAQRLIEEMRPDESTTRLEYDERSRLIARTGTNGTKVTYRYGPRGELLRVSEGDRETRLSYNEKLRLIRIGLPTGAQIQRDVDLFGRVLSQTGPDGQKTFFDYQVGADNPRGGLRTVTRPDHTSVSLRYNDEGLPVESIDPLGRTTHRSYGPFDLLERSVDAAGYTTHFTYDHATRLIGVTNAFGERYTYHYDAAGRLAAQTDWSGRTTHFERDPAGRLLRKSLPDGGEWRYSYDEKDRLTGLDAGDVKLSYSYDSSGKLRSANVDGESPHALQFEYDACGRLVGEKQDGEWLRHIYDEHGRRSARMSARRRTEYGYDALGLLTQLGALSIARDAVGRETHRRTGGFVAQQHYDVMGRIERQLAGPAEVVESVSSPWSSVDRSVLSQHSYTYDEAGQLHRFESDAETITYRHDKRGQVTDVSRMAHPRERYRYDATLNILSQAEGSTEGVHRYGPGRLIQQAGFAHYQYDERGRTIEKTVRRPGFLPRIWHYSWDGLNRLVKVVTPERAVWRYRYDAFNRRVEKRRMGGQEAAKFLWDGAVLAERWTEQRDGTTGQVVTWHIDPRTFAPLAQETDSGLYPVLADHAGTPKALFDQRGVRVWKAAHSLWGKLLGSRAAANDSEMHLDTSLRFAGQWEDDESGLHYNLNRYYDPDSGQYLSSDPIGLAGGFRTQAYVHDPVQWVDPCGLAPCSPTFNPDIPNHLTQFDGFNQQKGINGNHNLDEFLKTANDKGVKINSWTAGSKNGIATAEYQIPQRTSAGDIVLDPAGNTVYKAKLFEKTTYDPAVFSNQDIIDLGRQAATNGYADAVANNMTQYTAQAGGIDFRVYMDPATGYIRNYHPE